MCGLGYVVVDQTPGSDITQHLIDAMQLAQTQGKAVYLANSGTVSQTIELKVSLFGAGVHEVEISSAINDGSPILRRIDGDFITLSGFKVKGVDGNNVVGIQLGDPSDPDIPGTSVSRSILRDIRVTRCKTGLRHRGWLNRYSRVTADYCDLGVELDLHNGSDVDMILEQNKKDFRITNCSGMTARNITMEGTNHETASQIDNAKGLVIGSIYIEDGGASTEPWLHIGSSAVPSYNVKIDSVYIAGSGLPDQAVHIDNVSRADIGIVEYKCTGKVLISPSSSSVSVHTCRVP